MPDLDAYRAEAERFVAELGLEYYRHYAGLAEDLAVEAVYERHAALFERAAVEVLRERRASTAPGDEARRLRALLDFAVEGRVGRATAALDAELARREAILELKVDGERLGFRESSIVQANEPDRDRRARIEDARLEATERELNPLRREVLEPGPDRIEPLAPGHPGASWQVLRYERQLEVKHSQVDEALRRIGGLDGFAVEPNGVMAKCPSKYNPQTPRTAGG